MLKINLTVEKCVRSKHIFSYLLKKYAPTFEPLSTSKEEGSMVLSTTLEVSASLKMRAMVFIILILRRNAMYCKKGIYIVYFDYIPSEYLHYTYIPLH